MGNQRKTPVRNRVPRQGRASPLSAGDGGQWRGFVAAGRWSPVVVSHISPGIGTTHPLPQKKPVQTTKWKSETGTNCRQKAVPARSNRERRRTAGSLRCPGCRRLQPLKSSLPASGERPGDLDTHSGGTESLPESVAGELQVCSRFPCPFRRLQRLLPSILSLCRFRSGGASSLPSRFSLSVSQWHSIGSLGCSWSCSWRRRRTKIASPLLLISSVPKMGFNFPFYN